MTRIFVTIRSATSVWARVSVDVQENTTTTQAAKITRKEFCKDLNIRPASASWIAYDENGNVIAKSENWTD